MSHKPNMNLNTIFAAILIAGIVAMLASFVSRKAVAPHYPEHEAFPIEVSEVEAGAKSAGPVGPDPILALIATADLEKGQSLSKQCAACHDFSSGGPNRVGPNLYAIVGANKGKHADFAYSDALMEKGGAWTYQDLNHFLWKPKDYIAGTKMNFIGIKKPEDRAAMIAWLRTQGSSGYALPSEVDIASEVPEPVTIEAGAPVDSGTGMETEDGESIIEEVVEELAEETKEILTP